MDFKPRDSIRWQPPSNTWRRGWVEAPAVHQRYYGWGGLETDREWNNRSEKMNEKEKKWDK